MPIVAGLEQKELNIVFVALFNQHEKRMRRVISSSVACPYVPYFSK